MSPYLSVARPWATVAGLAKKVSTLWPSATVEVDCLYRGRWLEPGSCLCSFSVLPSRAFHLLGLPLEVSRFAFAVAASSSAASLLLLLRLRPLVLLLLLRRRRRRGRLTARNTTEELLPGHSDRYRKCRRNASPWKKHAPNSQSTPGSLTR